MFDEFRGNTWSLQLPDNNLDSIKHSTHQESTNEDLPEEITC